MTDLTHAIMLFITVLHPDSRIYDAQLFYMPDMAQCEMQATVMKHQGWEPGTAIYTHCIVIERPGTREAKLQGGAS